MKRQFVIVGGALNPPPPRRHRCTAESNARMIRVEIETTEWRCRRCGRHWVTQNLEGKMSPEDSVQ